MSAHNRPRKEQPSQSLKLTSGADLLDAWAQDAAQSQRNIVNRLLFAVVEKSVFSDYDVIDDLESPMEFFVLAKADLTVKIRIHDFESFGIIYVGASSSAPGLDCPGSDALEIMLNAHGAGEAKRQ
jgi:hypothetical protein